MKRIFCNILIAALISCVTAFGQNQTITSALESCFNRIAATRDDSERIRINDSVIYIIDEYSRSDSVISHRFSSIRNLGQITSPDRKVKIITWNLTMADGSNKYYCYIIGNEQRGKQLRVYKMTGISSHDTIRTDILYTTENWYGALYYDIRPFRTGRQTCYLLLGLDYHDLSLTRKIIEILSFEPDGEIIFGRNCFAEGDRIKSREVIEYSSEGVVTLRFANDRAVVFDHLVPISSDKRNDRQYFGAEFSYDAYLFRNGIWRFVRDFDIKNKK
ncbi:MAG: hypothetical protein IQL11_08360 [Bacteroidales bacterium]|nr:hypothetical protein [Bacteroidales bacterium]